MDINYAIIIDHHPITEPVKADFLDIREDYGANSSILTEYLKAGKIKPSSKLATALFYGIKTDTDNFIRASNPHDMASFKYLYPYINMQILKKIESSEMDRSVLPHYRRAIEQLNFIRDIAYVHMDRVDNPDLLVSLADFFLNIAEIEWSIVSGVYREKLIVILRYAGFHGDAGKTANDLFESCKGSTGGHRTAARAEIPLQKILDLSSGGPGLGAFVKTIINRIK